MQNHKGRGVEEPVNHSTVTMAKGAGTNLIGTMIKQGGNVVIQLLLARLLGRRDFGLFALAMTIFHLTGSFFMLGLGKVLVRYGPEHVHSNPPGMRKLIYHTSGIGLLSGLIAGATLYLCAPWLADHLFRMPRIVMPLQVFATVLPFFVLFRILLDATRVSLEMKYVVFADSLALIFTNLLLVLILVYALDIKLPGAVYARLIAFVCGLLATLVFIYRLYFTTGWNASGKTPGAIRMIAFGVPASMVGFTALLNKSIDKVLIGFFLSPVDVGVFQVAFQVSMVFVVLLVAFQGIFGPLTADLYAGKKYTEIAETYRTCTKWGILISLPVVVFILFNAREILITAFGPGYYTGQIVVAILVVSRFFQLSTGPIGPALIMTGRQNAFFLISVLSLVASVLLNLFLIPAYGLTGAALTTLITVAFWRIAGMLLIRRHLAFWPYDFRIIKVVLPLLAISGLSLLWNRYFPDENLLMLFLQATVIMFVYLAILLLQKLDPEDRDLLQRVMRKVRLSNRSTS